MNDAADPDETPEQPVVPSEPPNAPKRGAFPTPRSVIEQARPFVPEQPTAERDPRRAASSDADRDR